MSESQEHQFLVLEGITELTLETAQRNAHGLPTLVSSPKLAILGAAHGERVAINAVFKSTS
nr:hypothetical protein FFPRI1PSEUD_13200 [Pseudomonas sp. FFPRI_1]